MCTALSFNASNHYFGRNLDWEYSFGEKITITPRNFEFHFKTDPPITNHYAIIGMAITENNYPLYFDATNEKGVSIAGLNFPSNAVYKPYAQGKYNITPYEFIPWILCKCTTVNEAEALIKNVNFLNEPFSKKLPLTPLHWLISDKNNSIVVEPLKDGVKIYQNPIGVLTNNPTFDIQMHNLNNYMGLSSKEPENNFSDKIDLSVYSNGMGALGLPGDLSSQSRFVRASFTKLNIARVVTEQENVSTFFHILSSVEQQKGCVKTSDGHLEYTIYSSCCNTEKGIYYLKTYYGNTITSVNINEQNLNSTEIISCLVK